MLNSFYKIKNVKSRFLSGKKIYKIILLCLLSSVLLPLTSFSQITFQKTFDLSSNFDEATSVQQTSDGGYIIAGYISKGHPGLDSNVAVLIKTDVYGDTLWTKTFDGAAAKTARSVQQTTDGGYIITGTSGSQATAKDVFLIKADANGNPVWTKTFGGPGTEEGYSVRQTTDGGYIITGYCDPFSPDFYVYLIKTDANGDSLWTKTYGGGAFGWGNSVWQTTDGGYVITGVATNAYNVSLIKTDSVGNSQWMKFFGTNYDQDGYFVRQTADGGYIIAGSTWSSGAGNYANEYLIKTDTMGNLLWSKIYGNAEFCVLFSVEQTTDGGYILCGLIDNDFLSIHQAHLIKTDANGDTLWTKGYGIAATTIGNSVQQTSDGGYIITGTAFHSSSSDIILFKTDSLGNTGCVQVNPVTNLSITTTQQTNSTAIPVSTPTIVNNPATVVGSGAVVTTLCTSVGINTPVFYGREEVTIAPNPLVTQSKLTFKNPSNEKFLFTLYDITGRMTGSVSTTTDEIILTRGSKQPGVYLFHLDKLGVTNEKTGERWNGKIVVSD